MKTRTPEQCKKAIEERKAWEARKHAEAVAAQERVAEALAAIYTR